MLDMTARQSAVDVAQAMAHDPAFRTALADLIAFPTDASKPDAPLHAYLAHLSIGLAEMGFTTEGISVEGQPFLIASRIEDPDKPTVLGYAHGDTVPGMEGSWSKDRDPWTLTEDKKAGLWYGRGIADNKGQMLINLTAMQAVMAARGRLGFNTRIIIEMGEEIGSPGLAKLCEKLKPRLAADLLIASDGPRVAVDRPTIFLGARGGATFQLRLKRRKGGRHSGNFGGALANPALELAHALSRIASRKGALQVPGWIPDGVPEASRAALAGLTPAGGEVDEDWGAEGLTPAERIHAWNSAEILAFAAGKASAPVNAIPAEARAIVQLRYVLGIDDSDLGGALRKFLDDEGFADIAITQQGPSFRASATPADHPAVQFVAASMDRTFGEPPVVLPSLGGSLPNDIFTDILGLPTVWVPHSYPGCSQHAPNEHLPAEIFAEAAGLMAGLYWDLGEVSRERLHQS
ncbi:MAG: M20/M25/M40 family metallo-hydrolase [Roseicyclus sp.]|jgi:acetylornithine deacetylase/succinyl-diaminopimelate desuccinylase-like protein